MADPDDRKAPPDKIWVCMQCGNTSDDRFGMEGKVSPHWDASCTLNAKLFFRNMLKFDEEGHVKEIIEPAMKIAEKKKVAPKVRKS